MYYSITLAALNEKTAKHSIIPKCSIYYCYNAFYNNPLGVANCHIIPWA